MIHSKLKHKNIVKLIDFYSDSSTFYMRLELCDDDLAVLITRNFIECYEKTSLQDLKILLHIFLQILDGVNYLHTLVPPIIHRDIKPTNILIKEEKNSVIFKLCDFGLSKTNEDENTPQRGTIRFMAPEVYFGNTYTEKADIFSLAIVGIELFKMKFKQR